MKAHANTQPKRVLIVDDHPIICKGLAEIIEGAGMIVCGTAADANAAVTLAAQCEPDAAVVDISLKSSSGLDLIKALVDRHPGVRILVYSMHEEGVYAERALRAGARGYVMKDQPPEAVLRALEKVIAGHYHFSDAILARLLDRLAASPAQAENPLAALTDRELEIFTLIGHELSVGQIAKKITISTKTVEAHREHIRKKLGFRDSNELKRYAVEWLHSRQKNT